LLLCLPVILFGQTTLGQPDIWYFNPVPTYHVQNYVATGPELIGNYSVLKPDTLLKVLEKVANLQGDGHTIFFMVSPKITLQTFFTYKALVRKWSL